MLEICNWATLTVPNNLKNNLWVTDRMFRVKCGKGVTKFFLKQARGSHRFHRQKRSVLLSEFAPFRGKRVTWLHLWGLNEWPSLLFRPDKCDLLRTGGVFDPKSYPTDSNLYCGQMDLDFPCGVSVVTENVNKQEFKLDLIEKLT